MKNRKTTILTLSFLFVFSGIYSIDFVQAEQKKKDNASTRLMIMKSDGTNARELYKSKTFNRITSPTYSPDGKKIAMNAWRANTGQDYGDSRIIVFNADGTGMIDLGDGGAPSWSPDMKQIAFNRFEDGNDGNVRNSGVWLMDADGKNRTAIDDDGWSPQWSPNGEKILFTDHEELMKIYDTKSKKIESVQIPNQEHYSFIYWDFSWSPDSKIICFKALAKTGKIEIASLHLPTKDLVTHYSCHAKLWISPKLSWHPSGERVIFSRYSYGDQSGRVYWFDPYDGETPPKTLPNQNYKGIVLKACYSPDGKNIIFTMRKNVLKKKPNWVKE